MVTTMRSYLDQLAVSSRPSTVDAASLALRHLAAHVTESDPTCTSVAAIERRHVEAYKVALAARPGKGRNKTVSSTTIRHNLGMARTFFERIIDWDYPDAPRRVPIFTGDLPKADEPTPKFLDDPTAAKFMAALATDPNRRRRLIVELLARTGMRAGEIGGLRDDAMYRLGDTYWLRIPLGKLHNDRSVPLHPLLVGLINDYRAWRGPTSPGCSSNATTTSPSTGAPSTATCKQWPDGPASAVSIPTSSATPSPPNASTGACRWKPSPLCWAIAHPG